MAVSGRAEIDNGRHGRISECVNLADEVATRALDGDDAEISGIEAQPGEERGETASDRTRRAVLPFEGDTEPVL
jgi:hypothetical protein